MTTMLILPRPPSVNECFRNVPKKGRVRTDVYKNWATAAGLLLNRQKPHHVPGPYALDIFVGPMRGDPDNLIKPASDLLVTAGVVEDDRHAHRACIEIVASIPPGEIHCIVRPWNEVGRIADQFAFPVQMEGKR